MPKNEKFLAIRLFASLLLGIVVFLISVLAVWRVASDQLMTNLTIDSWTISALRTTDEFLHKNIRETGNPPESLDGITEQLQGKKFLNSDVPMVRHGEIVDGWGRPLLYASHGTTYTLQSYGRDGRPGGKGFDRDFSNTSDYWATPIDWENPAVLSNPPTPTLRRFLFELPTLGMIKGCMLSGILAFIVGFFLIRPDSISRTSMRRLAVRAAVTVGASVYFALVIMGLHIPTGH